MSGLKGRVPIPGGVSAAKAMAVSMQTPLMASASGELTANKHGIPLGALSVAGKVSGVWLSVAERGVDATDPLSVEVDVKINGTSVLSTTPKISALTGGGQADSVASGEGVRIAVLDGDNVSGNQGDMVTADFTVIRTTPDTEISTPVVIVDLEPSLV